MKSNPNGLLRRSLLLGVLLLLGAAVVWTFHHSGGKRLKISPGVKKLVEENFLQYSSLSYTALQNEEVFRNEFRRAVMREGGELPSDALRSDLADFLAEVLLSKGAGDFDRYEKCCNLRARFIPSDEILDFYQTWFYRNPPSVENARDLAREMFLLESQYKGGKHRFAACSFDKKGVRMNCVRAEDVSGYIDTAKELSEEERRYWFGPIANGSYHFFAPDIPIEEVVRKYGSVLWVDFQIVVKTRDGDMYPLRMRLWHHPEMNQWILDAGTRQSSIRAATMSPSLVF